MLARSKLPLRPLDPNKLTVTMVQDFKDRAAAAECTMRVRSLGLMAFRSKARMRKKPHRNQYRYLILRGVVGGQIEVEEMYSAEAIGQ